MFLNNKNYQGLAVAWTGIAANFISSKFALLQIILKVWKY